jgi:trehalose 6-phosphate phosphatase
VNGKKVIEVHPGLNWTKGHATLWLVKHARHPSPLPIYIGDDRTDEDAFDMLREGITIRVGKHRRSKAQYYVKNVREVLRLLEWMTPAREA